jgi:arylsulfatase A-like enzyme
MVNIIFRSVLILFLLQGCRYQEVQEVKTPNILFIAIDDLRPELGVFGNHEIKTPNMDALGYDGVVFENAYVQQAVCNPSRASLLTGLRPDYTKVRDLYTNFRDSIPHIPTIPQHLARHGYTTTAIGKIFHNVFPDSLSWTEPKIFLKQFPFDPDAVYVTEENLQIQNKRIQERLSKNNNFSKDQFGHYYVKANATEIVDGPDSLYYDGAQTLMAIKKLDELANEKNPFFFAIGYYKPHLPFNAPKKYWDLYNPDSISMATNPFVPKNVSEFSVNPNAELKGYTDYKNAPSPLEGSLAEAQARHLKHGYYASVSYIDKLIGDLISKLKALDIYDNTIIVLWGDHGYKLGEHNGWAKFTNYQIDAHAPLIIKSHQHAHNQQRISSLSEFVDIYPTLCDLTNTPLPMHLQGSSLVPLMSDISIVGKQEVYFQFLKESRWAVPEGNEQMGYSVLTNDYHYVYWLNWKTKEFTADELYDLKNDPEENTNVAELTINREIVSELRRKILTEDWKKNLK